MIGINSLKSLQKYNKTPKIPNFQGFADYNLEFVHFSKTKLLSVQSDLSAGSVRNRR